MDPQYDSHACMSVVHAWRLYLNFATIESLHMHTCEQACIMQEFIKM